MVEKLTPESGKTYFINTHTMLHHLEGTGSIEVDFKTYHDWMDKLIFLEPGQYVRFLSDDFVARRIEFSDIEIFANKEFRVLFKHLISLGYIDFESCEACQRYLDHSVLNQPSQVLDISSKQWFWQNPFGAKNDEYHVIFDVKDVIDSRYKNNLSNAEIADLIAPLHVNPQAVVTGKVGITVKKLLSNKRLTESKREVAFSEKSIKEIAYEYGYRNPAYFNRVFTSNTGTSPKHFRTLHAIPGQTQFEQDVYALLREFHTSRRDASFYAEKLHMPVKTLSRKIRDRLNTSIGHMIRAEIIKTAKRRLGEGMKVNEVAWSLSFGEANHFSAFFKHYTGETPGSYRNKKVQ